MTAMTDRHGRLVPVRPPAEQSPDSSPLSSPLSSSEPLPAAGGHRRRRMGRIARAAGFAVLAAIPLVMFALFFFYPVGSLIGRGLTVAGTVDAGGVIDVLG